MIRVVYNPNAPAISDGSVMEWAINLVENYKSSPLPPPGYVSVEVGNSTPINALRLLIVRRIISHESVTFVYNGLEIRPNQYGVIFNWPKGFCELESFLAAEIIETAFALRLRNRGELP